MISPLQNEVALKDRERAEIEAATRRFLAKNKVSKIPATVRNGHVHSALVLPGSIDHERGKRRRGKK